MNKVTSIMICASIAVTTSLAFADGSSNVSKSAIAVSSFGYPAAVAVAGPSNSRACAVAIAGVGVDRDMIIEKTSKDTSTSLQKDDKQSTTGKTTTKHVKNRGVAAMAVAGNGTAAAAVSPGPGSDEVSYQTSSGGNGSAMAAVGGGSRGFIGVTSVEGKKPKVYTSQEAMSEDLDSDGNPALGILQKLLDIFGW